MTKLWLAMVGVAVLVGCQQGHTTALDPARILHMAGEEAGQIAAPKERLTRQFNIANRETLSGRPADARKTLALARQTLEHADKKALNDQERLSGWVSLSELARYADDTAFANGALDRAMAALEELTPYQARCEYVPGIEREVRELRGDAAAAKLLTTAAEWAMELPEQATRRSAYFAFAEELFRCNDYEGARGVLRRDADAAWRSDLLTVMSDRARADASAMSSNIGVWPAATAKLRAPMAEAVPTGASPSSIGAPFGKSLDFRSNYLRP